ncbi:alpha/beta hydrolase [Dethiothermospora halolimnae]|uniref:alpha/beta hydrolase n=1 Tax=Dethiothermospora halolimnae TaxID=3114390 RepID=UPI003CCB97FF
MKYGSFKELEKDYEIPYIKGKYRETLDLLERGIKSLPKEEYDKYLYDIILFKAILKSKLKLYNACLDDLTYLIQEGYVCPLNLDSLSEPFAKNEEYIKLREKNDSQRRKKQENTKSKWEVLLPQNYNKEKKYPLFISLHGDGDSVEVHKEYWRPDELLNRGFIVVYLQASQVVNHNGYAWLKRVFYSQDKKDWSQSEDIYPLSETSYLIKTCYDWSYDELKTCYDIIRDKYSIDEKNIIIGGFSGGATAAIDFTMTNPIPIKGFISLSTQKPKSFNKENIEEALDRGIKGVFMEGEEDVPVEEVDKMIKEFDKAGVPYKYYINKGIGHWYPEDLNEKLSKAIKFIID